MPKISITLPPITILNASTTPPSALCAEDAASLTPLDSFEVIE